MTTLTINMPRFDIIEYIKKLRNVSFTQEQAETIAQETEHIIKSVIEQTKYVVENKNGSEKSDIYEVTQEVKKIEQRIIELELAIERVRYDSLKFIIWTGVGVVVTLSGIMFTLLRTMPH
jgi:predicted AlkP superfamily pyrophosphatase or phosphodiesterase